LLQTIESMLKLANMLRVPRVFKARRLLHVDFFLNKTVKKHININLSKTPSSIDSKRENQTKRN
jgi:hypothetical protein